MNRRRFLQLLALGAVGGIVARKLGKTEALRDYKFERKGLVMVHGEDTVEGLTLKKLIRAKAILEGNAVQPDADGNYHIAPGEYVEYHGKYYRCSSGTTSVSIGDVESERVFYEKQGPNDPIVEMLRTEFHDETMPSRSWMRDFRNKSGACFFS